MNYEAYRQGYSLGVGAVVLYANKALLIRRALGRHAGDWAIPSGFVEQSETIDVAIRREVMEEAGIMAEIEGLIAVRSRVMESENSAYLIFLLHADTGKTKPDGYEVDAARFFTVEEIERLSRLQPLSRLVTMKALREEVSVLRIHKHPYFPADEYVIYV